MLTGPPWGASAEEEAGGAWWPDPRPWTLAGAWEWCPSSALPGLAHVTPKAAAGCGFPGALPGPQVPPGPPGPLPSVTASPHPAPGRLLLSRPCLSRLPQDQRGPSPTELVRWPGGQSFSTQVAKAVTPLALALRRSGGAGARWGDGRFRDEWRPPCLTLRAEMLPQSGHQLPPPCQSSLGKGRGPGRPGSGPSALMAFTCAGAEVSVTVGTQVPGAPGSSTVPWARGVSGLPWPRPAQENAPALRSQKGSSGQGQRSSNPRTSLLGADVRAEPGVRSRPSRERRLP